MTSAALPDIERFPRASGYNPSWVLAGASGANALWMTEWLTQAMPLRPGMRVLDLGCGRGTSSVFLAREFGVQVWATDLWFDPAERLARFRDAGVADRVFPIHADARALPFATGYFDAVISIDSYPYYGTDDLFTGYLTRFLVPGGLLGIAGAGLTRELDGPPPAHLRPWWEPSMVCLHTPVWWRRHWNRSGLLDVEISDNLADGWRYWLAWLRAVSPDNQVEIAALDADQGRFLGYVRTVARRTDTVADESIRTIEVAYSPEPLLAPDRSAPQR